MRITQLPIVQEVREQYISLRKTGSSRKDAVKRLMEEYVQERTAGAEDDGPCFWIGLADGQYRRRELMKEVAEKALEALPSIRKQFPDVPPGDLERRQRFYTEAPMPERKVGPPRKRYQCNWKNGDTFLYRFCKDTSGKLGIKGSFAVLRKVGERTIPDGRTLPVMVMYFCPKAPMCADDLLPCVPLKLASGAYPVPYGYWQYRLLLMIRSKRQWETVPLDYVGNYGPSQIPADEVVYEDEVMPYLYPEKLEQNLCDFYRFNQFAETSSPEKDPELWPFWMTDKTPSDP